MRAPDHDREYLRILNMKPTASPARSFQPVLWWSHDSILTAVLSGVLCKKTGLRYWFVLPRGKTFATSLWRSRCIFLCELNVNSKNVWYMSFCEKPMCPPRPVLLVKYSKYSSQKSLSRASSRYLLPWEVGGGKANNQTRGKNFHWLRAVRPRPHEFYRDPSRRCFQQNLPEDDDSLLPSSTVIP